MKSQIVLIFTLVSIIYVMSHAALPAELYWDSVLPNTPMPEAIKKHIIPGLTEDLASKKGKRGKEKGGGGGLGGLGGGGLGGGGGLVSVCFNYVIIPVCTMKAATAQARFSTDNLNNIFFLEEDLKLGTTKSFEFVTTSNTANFLPRKVADSIPFSSKNMSQVLDELSIKPASDEAREIRQTMDICEAPAAAGEEKSCVTSLESMIDFTTSKLGRNVQVLTSEIEQESTQAQKYNIEGLKRVASDEKYVVCHKQSYPYAVFNCHMIFDVKAYRVSLVGAKNGTKIEAVAICHEDTSAWNPDHLAFHVLNVKPGTAPVCHFVPGDHIVWIPK